MNRLLVWEHEISDDGCVVLTGKRAEHLRDVLKVAVGDQLCAGIIDGSAAHATVIETVDNSYRLHITPDASIQLPAPPTVDLLLALPRPKTLRRLFPQLAVLGVRRLFLVSAERVERFYFDTQWLRPEHYLPLIIEGLEQSKDTRLPEVHIKRPYKHFLRDELAPSFADGCKLIAHPGARTPAERIPPAPEPALVAIGPEGGWTRAELEFFESLGFAQFSLGERVLRTDMACVAILSLVDYLRTQ